MFLLQRSRPVLSNCESVIANTPAIHTDNSTSPARPSAADTYCQKSSFYEECIRKINRQPSIPLAISVAHVGSCIVADVAAAAPCTREQDESRMLDVCAQGNYNAFICWNADLLRLQESKILARENEGTRTTSERKDGGGRNITKKTAVIATEENRECLCVLLNGDAGLWYRQCLAGRAEKIWSESDCVLDMRRLLSGSRLTEGFLLEQRSVTSTKHIYDNEWWEAPCDDDGVPSCDEGDVWRVVYCGTPRIVFTKILLHEHTCFRLKVISPSSVSGWISRLLIPAQHLPKNGPFSISLSIPPPTDSLSTSKSASVETASPPPAKPVFSTRWAGGGETVDPIRPSTAQGTSVAAPCDAASSSVSSVDEEAPVEIRIKLDGRMLNQVELALVDWLTSARVLVGAKKLREAEVNQIQSSFVKIQKTQPAYGKIDSNLKEEAVKINKELSGMMQRKQLIKLWTKNLSFRAANLLTSSSSEESHRELFHMLGEDDLMQLDNEQKNHLFQVVRALPKRVNNWTTHLRDLLVRTVTMTRDSGFFTTAQTVQLTAVVDSLLAMDVFENRTPSAKWHLTRETCTLPAHACPSSPHAPSSGPPTFAKSSSALTTSAAPASRAIRPPSPTCSPSSCEGLSQVRRKGVAEKHSGGVDKSLSNLAARPPPSPANAQQATPAGCQWLPVRRRGGRKVGRGKVSGEAPSFWRENGSGDAIANETAWEALAVVTGLPVDTLKGTGIGVRGLIDNLDQSDRLTVNQLMQRYRDNPSMRLTTSILSPPVVPSSTTRVVPPPSAFRPPPSSHPSSHLPRTEPPMTTAIHSVGPSTATQLSYSSLSQCFSTSFPPRYSRSCSAAAYTATASRRSLSRTANSWTAAAASMPGMNVSAREEGVNMSVANNPYLFPSIRDATVLSSVAALSRGPNREQVFGTVTQQESREVEREREDEREAPSQTLRAGLFGQESEVSAGEQDDEDFILDDPYHDIYPPWVFMKENNGDQYWFNRDTGDSQWSMPNIVQVLLKASDIDLSIFESGGYCENVHYGVQDDGCGGVLHPNPSGDTPAFATSCTSATAQKQRDLAMDNKFCSYRETKDTSAERNDVSKGLNIPTDALRISNICPVTPEPSPPPPFGAPVLPPSNPISSFVSSSRSLGTSRTSESSQPGNACPSDCVCAANPSSCGICPSSTRKSGGGVHSSAHIARSLHSARAGGKTDGGSCPGTASVSRAPSGQLELQRQRTLCRQARCEPTDTL
eukprot:GHVQ01035887.1.p1 GENE.GHVQ01035887.1~~GHVQ01035887.1.p1  ORF type:complete len:1240 (-),score=173.21 GHVQ01035887.1:597-4316(-)